MRREQFIQYLENPFLMGEASISELKTLVETYPFFQTAHLLYAKALSNVNHADYYTGLKKTSILAGDRKVLYNLITGQPKNNTANELSVTEEKKEERTNLITEIKKEEKKEISTPAIDTKKTEEEIHLPEIKLVSNTIAPVKNTAIKIDYEEKADELESPAKIELKETQKEEGISEKLTRVELVITPREKEHSNEDKNNVPEKQPEKKTIQEIHVPKEKNVDDVVLDRVVNAYIEKEILGVDEIDKPIVSENPRIDPEEGKQILTQTLNEPHSFSEWLKLLNQGVKPEPAVITEPQKEVIEDTKKTETTTENNSNNETPLTKGPGEEKEKIIEKIISSEPKISRPTRESKDFFKPQEKSKESILKDETLVTETLAWILEKQGKYPEAIKAYHFLSLKYPEKSVKFASLISEIRKKQKQK